MSAAAGKENPSRSSSYLPTLDGWRAIAVCLVILSHDTIHTAVTALGLTNPGHYGVEIFFAISGLLICTRLLEEEQISGTISLKRFYLRRLFRIQPAALTFLAVLAVLMLTGVLGDRLRGILYSLLLVRDYFPHIFNVRDWYTMHFWSLSVEEHFYFFLPLFLVTVRRHRIRILATLIVLQELWKRDSFRISPAIARFGWSALARTDYTVDAILIAVLAALLLSRPGARMYIARWLQPWIALVFAVLALWSLHRPGDLPIFAVTLSCTLLVTSTLLHPNSWTGRILESAPLRYIGRLSYSIYLWQSLFFRYALDVPAPHARWLQFMQSAPWRYIGTAVVSLLSYYLIEKPFIRIGHRVAPSPVPGRFEHDIIPADTVMAALAVPEPEKYEQIAASSGT